MNNVAVMRLLHAAAPDLLHAEGACGITAAHLAAQEGALDALNLLLLMAPHLATAADENGRTPIHLASTCGQLAAVQLLLLAAPHSAAAATRCGQTPLHEACWAGHLPVVEVLLAHAPQTNHAADSSGRLALHNACINGHAAVISHLLAAARGIAETADSERAMALHLAAGYGQADAVRLLLAVAPATALAADSEGETPLHLAARGAYHPSVPPPASCTAAVQMLLAAAPEAAHMPDDFGGLPLHAAAASGHTAAALPCPGRLPAAGAPGTAAVLNDGRETPFQVALACGHVDATNLLVAALPTDTALEALAETPAHCQPAVCLPAFMRAHLPLTDEQWVDLQLSVAWWRHLSVPDLAPLLPAALEHSPPQARQLVQLLSFEQKACLRTFGCAWHGCSAAWVFQYPSRWPASSWPFLMRECSILPSFHYASLSFAIICPSLRKHGNLFQRRPVRLVMRGCAGSWVEQRH